MSLDNFFNSSDLEFGLNYPIVRPTLNLNFTKLTKLSPIINFTRNSQATYFDKNGILQTAGINQPVFEWDPVTKRCLGLRIWEGVTNSLVQSQDFATTWTNSNLTVNTNTVTAPDGTLTADTFGPVVGDGLTAARFLRQNPALSTQGTYTLSVFVKIGTANANGIALYVSDQNGTNLFRANYNLFSLTTSPGATTWATPTAYIIPCSNGWYRCVLTGVTSTAHTSLRAIIYLNAFANTSDSYGTHHIWGAQLNTGALAPYVPTTGLTASSTADVVSITGPAFAGIVNSSEGSAFINFSTAATSANTPILSLYQASNSGGNRHSLRNGNVIITTNGVDVASFAQQVVSASAKAAYAYKANDYYYIVGSDGRSDTSGAVPVGIDSMNIGKVETSNIYLNGYIRQLRIYPVRLSNSQLKQLTS